MDKKLNYFYISPKIIIIMDGDQDKYVHVNIYGKNKQEIDNSQNKSESYIILANENLQNQIRSLIEEKNELINEKNEFEGDNERMERNIINLKGILHNINSIKKSQTSLCKLYEKMVKSNLNSFDKLQEFNSNLYKVLISNLVISCFTIFLTSLIFDIGSFLNTCIIQIIIIVLSYNTCNIFFNYNHNNVNNFIIKSKDFNNNYKCLLLNYYNEIKEIENKSDFIGELIDS